MKNKSILMGVGFLLIILFITAWTVLPIKSAIQEIVGLAIAQTSTRWNNLKDVASGAFGQTSGLGAFGSYLYNSASSVWDAMQGDRQYGLDVDVTRMPIINANILNTINASIKAFETGWVNLFLNTPTTGASSSYPIANVVHRITWVVNVANTPSTMIANLEAGDRFGNWHMLDNSISNTTEMRHVVNKGIDRVRANITTLNGVVNSPIPAVSIEFFGTQ